MALIPVTILTGFLGSGKTTLLKRVLTEAHGQKIAVIENEFGEENIDNDILVTDTEEQIIQMSNGCICCTIREDLRETLQLLAAKRRKGLLDFDRIVIETTGLADPGPVAQTFFMDDEIAETYLLDSILTLVDAKHAAQQLNDRQEARRQVGFADQIFISKTDLVRRRGRGPAAPPQAHEPARAAKAVHFGEVPLSEVFDLRGFNLNAKLDIDPDFLKEDEHDHHHDHDHAHGEHCDHPSHQHGGHGHHHHHDDDVKSFVYKAERLRPGQAGRLPGRHRQHLRPAHAALQGRAAHEGHRAQGDLPGRAPAHGQRPGPAMGPDEARQQDGVHRHRPAARHLSAGSGAVPGLRRPGHGPGLRFAAGAWRRLGPDGAPFECLDCATLDLARAMPIQSRPGKRSVPSRFPGVGMPARGDSAGPARRQSLKASARTADAAAAAEGGPRTGPGGGCLGVPGLL
jgi:G3E family GTPase